MNIGIFTDTYYPQINGVVTSTRMLEKELNKMGHKVFIFTTTDPKSERSFSRVFRLPSMPFIFLPTHRMCLMYSPKLLMKIRFLHLDIVHTQTEFPLGLLGKLVSEFCKIPLVHTYHTMYEDYVHYIANGHLITPKLAQRFSRIFCNRAQIVVVPVVKTEAKLLEYGVKRPIRVIPTGIDFDPFNPEQYTAKETLSLKTSLGIGLTDKIIVTVGRIAKEKSMDVIVRQLPEVIKKIPQTKLLIVGDGPVRSELEALAKDLGVQDSVIFTGVVPWDIIGKYYHVGDVFVTASTSETQGLTHIEAMAAHIPVIAKKDPSFESVIIDGQTGFYFEQDDQLPTVLAKLLNDAALRRLIAKQAFANIEHLSSKHFAKQIEALYYEVLNNQNQKPKGRGLGIVRFKRPR